MKIIKGVRLDLMNGYIVITTGEYSGIGEDHWVDYIGFRIPHCNGVSDSSCSLQGYTNTKSKKPNKLLSVLFGVDLDN